MKNNLSGLPDLAKLFQRLKISLDLGEKVKENTTFGLAILLGLKNKQFNEVLDMIYSSACDNRELVADIVGVNTLRDIENYLTDNVKIN